MAMSKFCFQLKEAVLFSAKVEGTGIYDLLSPPLLSSMHQIQVEVLGCLEELLKQLTSNSSKRFLFPFLFFLPQQDNE